MTQTGIFKDMSEDVYFADPCDVPSLSNSVAKVLITQSPLHAWMAHPKLNPNYSPTENERFDLGSAAHALLLEGKSARIAVIDAADWRTKAAREARDEARANGLLPILQKHDRALKAMVEVANAAIEDSELKGIFSKGAPEQSLIWTQDGIACRSRLDFLSDDHRIIIDYKTCANAAPDAFLRSIANYSYDLQAVFYQHGVSAITGVDPAFVFLAQEIEPPYACSLHSLSNAYYALAEAKFKYAVDLWRECVKANKWPGYSNRVCYAEPPAWVMNEMMSEEENGLSV